MSTAWESEISSKTELVFPAENAFSWEAFLAQKPLVPFDPGMLSLCEAFSKRLLSDPRCAGFPDLTALGFWFRGLRLRKMKDDFVLPADSFCVGRGLVFHLAPGNVDTIFIYSMFHGLLSGNINVVRLGGRVTAQQELLLELLSKTLEEFPVAAKRILLVRYAHDDAVTAFFSAACHVRVIWGGDETVNHIRQIPIPAGSSELTFSGKFSFAVFDAVQWLNAENPGKYIPSFLTDSFSFGQQGCSSPKLICWLGDRDAVRKARESFWSAVDAELALHPRTLSPAEAMTRCLATNSTATEASAPVRLSPSGDLKSYLRLELESWEDLHRELNTGNGLFYELRVPELADVLNRCEDSDQTVLSYGISREAWREAIRTNPPRGICRIVPFGKALEFNSVWDGTDLIAFMTKKIIIQA